MNCEHKFVYLRGDIEEEVRIQRLFDVFFCEKCLSYRRILRVERYENGDGRWTEYPKLTYA